MTEPEYIAYRRYDDKMMRWIDWQVLQSYPFSKEILERMNTMTHHYTCLPSPPELEQHGLTHMVCRVDMPTSPVCAFNSSAAASRMCDQLNGFASQDKPELLGPDTAEVELAEANRQAAEREGTPIVQVATNLLPMTQELGAYIEKPPMTLQEKIDAAKAATK